MPQRSGCLPVFTFNLQVYELFFNFAVFLGENPRFAPAFLTFWLVFGWFVQEEMPFVFQNEGHRFRKRRSSFI